MSQYNNLASKFKDMQLQKNAESLKVNHPLYRMEKAAIEKEIKEITFNFTVLGHVKNGCAQLATTVHFKELGYKIVPAKENTWFIVNTGEQVRSVAEVFPTLKDLRLDEEDELGPTYYRKCSLNNDDGSSVEGWLPELGIRLGSRVRVDKDPTWWKISSIGDCRLPEAQARILYNQNAKH